MAKRTWFISKDTILDKDELDYKFFCKTKRCIGYYVKHRCVDLGR